MYKIDWQKANSIISVKNADKNYLFSEQFKKIEFLCNEIIQNRKTDFITESIIGIVGERGSGKSSLLKTVKDNLKNFYVLDTLDPSAFDDSMSILELFISSLYKVIVTDEDATIDDNIVIKMHNQLKYIYLIQLMLHHL